MRTGICTEVLTGDTILLERGRVRVRYSNVWSPAPGSALGDAVKAYNEELVLGRTLTYQPNGHIHWDGVSIIADVYADDRWVNQALRDWLSARTEATRWLDGEPRPADGAHEL